MPGNVAAAKDGWGLDEGDEIVPGRYAIRRLGGGVRFEVYLATDERMHATVIAKILRPSRAADRAALAALRAEAETLARLAHPHVVRSFGAVPDGPRPHIVLEHLEGPTLRSLVKRYGPLPVEQLVPLGVSLASALHYLRAERTVHLDVKPANVVMGSTPALVDFSVARTFDDAAAIAEPVGTFPYMSPEQCAPTDRGPIGAAADVWGLGVTLYVAASGARPFPRGDDESRDPSERFPQLAVEPAALPRKVAPIVAETILSCLAKDPSARPSASGVAEALEPVLAALPRRPVLGRLRPRIARR